MFLTKIKRPSAVWMLWGRFSNPLWSNMTLSSSLCLCRNAVWWIRLPAPHRFSSDASVNHSVWPLFILCDHDGETVSSSSTLDNLFMLCILISHFNIGMRHVVWQCIVGLYDLRICLNWLKVAPKCLTISAAFIRLNIRLTTLLKNTYRGSPDPRTAGLGF